MASGQDAVNMAMLAGGMYGPNPYTSFPGKVPQPNYAGVPTDAHGNPIGPPLPPPGLTLNSIPAAAAPASQTYGLQPSDLAGPSPLNPTGNQAFGMANWGGMMSPQAQQLYANQQFAPPGSPRGTTYANSAAAAPVAPAGPPAGEMTLDDALTRLSNPGHVTTPGATPGATGGGGSDILSQFLASQGPRTGAGGYSNKGFFDTLNALQSGSSPPQPSTDLTPAPAAPIAQALAPVAAPPVSFPRTPPPTAAAATPPAIGGLGGLGGLAMGGGGGSVVPAQGGLPIWNFGRQGALFDGMGRQLADQARFSGSGAGVGSM